MYLHSVDKYLHIITLDIPYPVDYGGVVDLFYKLKAISAQGIKIHLHCFEYGRKRRPELQQYCESVRYYKRVRGFGGFSFNLPYIVSSRINPALVDNLLMDDHPILMEGIHCSFLLKDNRFQKRRLFLRLHNVEHIYYHHLARSTRSVFQKLYFKYESKALFKYEKSIARAVTIIAVSEQDELYYRKHFNADRISYLPVFLPSPEIHSQEGTGSYCLYHGNLSVPENEKAVKWLLREVFPDIKTALVIAGKNPSKGLQGVVSANANCCLVANPTVEEMQDLVAKAQVHVLPSFNRTGVKLKVLNALFNGRHCVLNQAAVDGASFEKTCHVTASAEEMKRTIARLFHIPFTSEDISLRKMTLNGIYNNEANARRLIQLIW